MNGYLRIASLAAALVWAVPVNAAVLTYNYQGQPLVCSGGGICGPSTPWIGELVIDESFLPGGSINGLTLSFGWHVFFGQILDYRVFRVSDQGGVLAEYSEHLTIVNGIHQSPSFDWSEYGIIEGRYNYIFWEGYAGVASGNFSITFDASGIPAAWSGMIMFGAGEIDHFTTNGIGSSLRVANFRTPATTAYVMSSLAYPTATGTLVPTR